MKSVRIRSYSVPYFPTFGLNTERHIIRISPYSVRMREKKDQNNSEYGHFLRSVKFANCLKFRMLGSLRHRDLVTLPLVFILKSLVYLSMLLML